jgi:ubiquinone/menaquinone biosynthesis C-methylase UbiE
MMEREAKEWLVKAKTRAQGGALDRMVAQELFDHTWIASVTQLQCNLRIADGQKVLDAGCGWGRLLFGLKYFHPSLSIDGYELTAEFVEKARKILNNFQLQEGVRITQGDLTEIEIPRDHYDSFYSSRVLHYIEKKQAVIEKLYRCLKRGGRGMIILPNKYCPYRWLTYRHAPLVSITAVGKMMEEVGFGNLFYGGYGFLPTHKRFHYNSPITGLEKYLAATPLNRLAGLAYVVGDK